MLQKKDYLDYLKAFAIILVVVGHSIGYHTEIKKDTIYEVVLLLIYAVHVPMFFFIAGYLCKKQDIKKYYIKKVNRIIVPFIMFTILKLIYSIFISNEFSHSTSLIKQVRDAFVYGELYWFIYAIFIMYCIAPLLWSRDNDKKCKQRNIFIFVCLIILNCVFSLLKIDITMIKIFQLGNVIKYFVYFMAGMICQQNSIHKFIKYNKVLSVLSVLIIAILTFIIMKFGLASNYLLKVILAFALMYLFYRLAKILPKKVYILKVIGRYSLQIMFFDSFFKVILFMVADKFISMSMLWAIVIAIINVTLGCVCCVIIERIPYIKRLFGV